MAQMFYLPDFKNLFEFSYDPVSVFYAKSYKNTTKMVWLPFKPCVTPYEN